MSLKNCILQMVLLYVSLYTSYDSQCPHSSQWNVRALHNCNAIPHYYCLFDEIKLKYTEFCRENQDFEGPGFQLVIHGGLDGKSCAAYRYQPFIFWTNGSSECTFQKSLCREEGQMILTEKSTSKDVSCRCDYTKGFSFVLQPTHITYCVPSEEDCSCYIKPCPDGYILNTGYQCIEDIPRNKECATNDPSVPSKNISTVMKALNVNTGSRNGLTRGKITITFILVLVPVVIVVILWIYIVKKKTDNCTNKRDLQHTRGICIKEVHTAHFEEPVVKKQQIHLDYVKGKAHPDIIINTKVLLCIYITLRDSKITVISGPPECGKTSFLYHAAMKLGEADNYKICFVSNPVKLIESINIEEKQIFVIDDIGGKNSLNEDNLQTWRANADSIFQIVNQSLKTKLILTCRSCIYSNKQFSLLELPHMHCDMLATERFLRTVEMRL